MSTGALAIGLLAERAAFGATPGMSFIPPSPLPIWTNIPLKSETTWPAFCWVLVHDGGCGEGHSEPLQAFMSEEDALRAQKMTAIGNWGTPLKLCKVPLWPNVEREEQS